MKNGNMELSILDKLQLKRIERKIAKKKDYLRKVRKEDRKLERHGITIEFFSSPFWLHENVKNILRSKGYKVVHFMIHPKLFVEWK